MHSNVNHTYPHDISFSLCANIFRVFPGLILHWKLCVTVESNFESVWNHLLFKATSGFNSYSACSALHMFFRQYVTIVCTSSMYIFGLSNILLSIWVYCIFGTRNAWTHTLSQLTYALLAPNRRHDIIHSDLSHHLEIVIAYSD